MGSPPGRRYVALGDSYTIGTSVAGSDRWPDQLVEVLAHEEPRLELVANLARNGWTSGDVIRGQLPQLGRLAPEFASLLIGVNDVVQHVPAQTYRVDLARILDDLLGRLPRDRILAVTTPDYTVTPAGASFGTRTSSGRPSYGSTRSWRRRRSLAASPSWTSSTSRRERLWTARWSPPTGSIPRGRNTPSGSPGSPPSWPPCWRPVDPIVPAARSLSGPVAARPAR